MTWSATYNSANQKTSEVLANGGQTTRQFGYTFHTSGSFAGLLQQSVDGGRSITHTYAYDDFLRVSTDTAVGALPEQGAVTSFGYDANGTVTNLLQTSGINPTTELRRRYDGYGQLTNEMVLLGGVTNYAFDQKWDAAGRRATLKGATAQFDYQYRVDGLLSRVTGFGSAYNFSYGDNGLLSSRSNPWRVTTINSRDGRGRVLGVTTTIGASAALVESQTWRANTTLDTYSATRAGSGAFNDARGYAYTGRGQLLTESLGVKSNATATATYDFDAAKLGVRTRAAFTGGLTNVWAAAAGSPDSLARINLESGPMGLYSFQASGLAFGAATVFGTLDGTPLGTLDFTPLPSGRWTKDLTLASGPHTLNVSAVHPLGRYTNTVASAFSVQSVTATTNTYDDAGFVVLRRSAGGQTNSLKWDAAGRLVRVIQRNPQASGYDWSAVYDGLGRRLRTTHTNVTSGVPAPSGTVLDSLFDPQVEFLEVGVALNGARTWKVLGPDLDGHYGSAQGVGALEATVRESDQAVTPVVQDRFGNALATVAGGQAEWTPVRVSGYGPVLGDQAPVLSASAPLAKVSLWRGKRIDPTGFYCLGARYYDATSGRFLSPDPAGHDGSWDLYSFANNDPVNQFDPDGRFGKAIQNNWRQFEGQMEDLKAQRALMPEGSGASAFFNTIPILGQGKMFFETLIGKDLVTGQRVNEYEHALWTVLGTVALAAGPIEGVASSGGWAMSGGMARMGGTMSLSAATLPTSPAMRWAASQVVQSPTMSLVTAGATSTGSSGAGQAVILKVNAGKAAPTVVDLRRVLQSQVDQSVAQLRANPSLAKDLMSPGSYLHLVNRTGLADASYGKAVERLTAQNIVSDSTLQKLFSYQSRPFVSTPDFFGYQGSNMRVFDITTRRGINSHLGRSYGSFTEYVTHPGLPVDLMFTP